MADRVALNRMLDVERGNNGGSRRRPCALGKRNAVKIDRSSGDGPGIWSGLSDRETLERIIRILITE